MLIEAANSEIADQIATDVLIIEDEPLIADDLRERRRGTRPSRRRLTRTHKEAVEAIKRATRD